MKASCLYGGHIALKPETERERLILAHIKEFGVEIMGSAMMSDPGEKLLELTIGAGIDIVFIDAR